MHYYILFLSFFISPCFLLAQIKGEIKDEKGKNIEFVNVSLHQLPDSVAIDGQLTDEKGFFSFAIPPKNNQFYIKASQMGYKENYTQIFTLDNIPPKIVIVLEEDTKILEGVEIIAKKNFIDFQGDKTILNVENSVFSTGLATSEILKRAPGVALDQNGNISLKGRKEVMVLIDGKPTYLTDEQVGRLLKSLPSNQVASIEISTSPSAKYDAEGNAGMINIRLKKNAMNGLNGNITLSAGQGFFSKQNSGLQLNYKKGITNLMLNYDFNYDAWLQNYGSQRTILQNNQSTFFDQYAYYRVPNFTHTLKIGADFMLSPQFTLGLQGTALQTSNRWIGGNETLLFTAQNLEQKLVTQDLSRDFFRDYTANIYLKYEKDSTTQWSFDVDYAKFDQNNTQGFITNTFNGLGSVIAPLYRLNSTIPTKMDIFAVKTDFTKKLNKNLKLETGLKMSWVKTNNDMRFFEIMPDETQIVDTRRTNYFIYTENIWVGYVNFTGKLKKMSYQIGLRGEQTFTRGEQRTINDIFTRQYFNLFPQVSVDYKISTKNNIAFNYNRRIDRPNYKSLNPFVYFLDLFASEAGNSFLTPQFTNHTELNYRFDEWLQITLNYSQTNNSITDVLKQNSTTRELIYTEDNLATFNNYGVALNIALPITKNWETNHFVNIFRNEFSGVYLDTPLNNKSWGFLANAQHQIRISKKFDAEISGNYFSNVADGIALQQQRWSVACGVQMRFWNDNATLKASMNDIFWTDIYRQKTTFADINASSLYRSDTRVFTLAFNFRFGNSLFNQKKQRKTALEEEKERMKGK